MPYLEHKKKRAGDTHYNKAYRLLQQAYESYDPTHLEDYQSQLTQVMVNIIKAIDAYELASSSAVTFEEKQTNTADLATSSLIKLKLLASSPGWELSTPDEDHDQHVANRRLDESLALAQKIMVWHKINHDNLKEIKDKNLIKFINNNHTNFISDTIIFTNNYVLNAPTSQSSLDKMAELIRFMKTIATLAQTPEESSEINDALGRIYERCADIWLEQSELIQANPELSQTLSLNKLNKALKAYNLAKKYYLDSGKPCDLSGIHLSCIYALENKYSLSKETDVFNQIKTYVDEHDLITSFSRMPEKDNLIQLMDSLLIPCADKPALESIIQAFTSTFLRVYQDVPAEQQEEEQLQALHQRAMALSYECTRRLAAAALMSLASPNAHLAEPEPMKTPLSSLFSNISPQNKKASFKRALEPIITSEIPETKQPRKDTGESSSRIVFFKEAPSSTPTLFSNSYALPKPLHKFLSLLRHPFIFSDKDQKIDLSPMMMKNILISIALASLNFIGLHRDQLGKHASYLCLLQLMTTLENYIVEDSSAELSTFIKEQLMQALRKCDMRLAQTSCYEVSGAHHAMLHPRQKINAVYKIAEHFLGEFTAINFSLTRDDELTLEWVKAMRQELDKAVPSIYLKTSLTDLAKLDATKSISTLSL